MPAALPDPCTPHPQTKPCSSGDAFMKQKSKPGEQQFYSRGTILLFVWRSCSVSWVCKEQNVKVLGGKGSSVPAASGEGRLFGCVSTLGAKEIWERFREHCSGTSYKLIVLSFPSTLQFFGFQSR